jgi:hypothetical protein
VLRYASAWCMSCADSAAAALRVVAIRTLRLLCHLKSNEELMKRLCITAAGRTGTTYRRYCCLENL